MQLDLFEHTNVAPDELLIKFLDLKSSQDSLRRGIFQRFNDLRNVVADLQGKLDQITQKEEAHEEKVS